MDLKGKGLVYLVDKRKLTPEEVVDLTRLVTCYFLPFLHGRFDWVAIYRDNVDRPLCDPDLNPELKNCIRRIIKKGLVDTWRVYRGYK